MKGKMTLIDYLVEATKAKKEVFVDTNKQLPFPDATVSAIEREINKGAKDVNTEWDDASELVNYAFEELNLPIPQVYLTERWGQYKKLLRVAIDALADTRGNKGQWRTTV